MLWWLLWLVLVLGAAAVFAVIGRSLWRKGKALAKEMGDASERLAAVASTLEQLADHSDAHPAHPAADRPAVPAVRVRGRRERRHPG